MRILIIGATGFIGRELVKELTAAGHSPVAVSRDAVKAAEILGNQIEIAGWDGISADGLAKMLTGAHALVNLAGENLASKRWTWRQKKIITQSRLKTSGILTEAISLSSSRPSVLLQASATGFYGTQVEEPADESHPAGTGFLAELTRDWELPAESAHALIPRIVLIRSGLVLGKNGGSLGKMLLPFRFGCGAVLGSGRQWMSWIHIKDEARAIRFLLENDASCGPYNLTSPEPARMKDFMKTLGKSIGKPVCFRVPALLLKIALGEMAEETVLASQNIYPGKLFKEGFQFEFPRLPDALKDLLTEAKD